MQLVGRDKQYPNLHELRHKWFRLWPARPPTRALARLPAGHPPTNLRARLPLARLPVLPHAACPPARMPHKNQKTEK